MTRFRTDSAPNRNFLMAGGALVVVILVWAITRSGVFSDEAPQADRPEPAVVTTQAPEPVARFLAFTAAQSASNADASHAYTADGLRLLAGALESVSGSVDVAVGTREILTHADAMQNDSTATTHSRHAREAAQVASTLLGRIQESRRPELTEELRAMDEAMREISAERRLLEQTGTIQKFFAQSAQLVEKLGR